MSSQFQPLSQAEIDILRRTVPELRTLRDQQQPSNDGQGIISTSLQTSTNSVLLDIQAALHEMRSEIKSIQTTSGNAEKHKDTQGIPAGGVCHLERIMQKMLRIVERVESEMDNMPGYIQDVIGTRIHNLDHVIRTQFSTLRIRDGSLTPDSTAPNSEHEIRLLPLRSLRDHEFISDFPRNTAEIDELERDTIESILQRLSIKVGRGKDIHTLRSLLRYAVGLAPPPEGCEEY
ncbi:hypothetical protein MMC10_005620 [Thelotrema lepadinum]|nr:hypothetical protein [Thelotrema lepadinum]